MKNRRKEIISLVPKESLQLVDDVIDNIVFLEEKLEELKAFPFIQVDPKDHMRQRSTPASKQYKEFLQQYINCIKVIESVIYKDKRLESETPEESPLRKWFKANEV